MPDIDPAALSRTGSGPQPSTVPLPAAKSIAPPKTTKTASLGQRIDLEPVYTALKQAVGENWVAYKETISLFMLGHLNQTELSSRIDHFISADPTTEHLHNQLIAGIYGNVTRDLPDHGVAIWVSANDKPTNISKPVTGDAAEQRLKTEVMQLSARDRRRIKDIPDVDPFDTYSSMLTEHHASKRIKLPDMVPASAGGLNKTNWELEIRKRYSQPLASESGEFPDTETIQNRMEPICYEEGVTGGCSDGTAAFMSVATETFIKEVLTGIFGRTRSNGLNYVMTASYKKQLQREEEAFLRGDLAKNNNSLLPVEQTASSSRPPLGIEDLRLALEMGDMYLGHMPLTVEKIMGGYLEGELQDGEGVYGDDNEIYEVQRPALTNGVATVNGVTPTPDSSAAATVAVPAAVVTKAAKATMPAAATVQPPTIVMPPGDDPSILEDSDWGWAGGAAADREALGALLDECLAVGL